VQTRDLCAERRPVNGTTFVLDVDVVLAGRQSPVDDSDLAVLLFLLENFGLSGSVDLYVNVFCNIQIDKFSFPGCIKFFYFFFFFLVKCTVMTLSWCGGSTCMWQGVWVCVCVCVPLIRMT